MLLPLNINFKQYWSLWLFGLICFVALAFEMINDRFWMSDLEVYYRSAGRLIRGENLYRVPSDDFYVYKYAPVACLPFVVLTIFNFFTAKIIYWILLSVGFIGGMTLSFKTILQRRTSDIRHFNLLVMMLGISIFIHIFRELHLGQVNFMLFLCYLFMLYAYQEGKPAITSLLLAFTIFFKPFGLIFIPYFLVKKEYKLLGYFFIWATLLFFLPLLFIGSIDKFLHQHKSWLMELLIELFAKRDLTQAGNHTVFSVVFRHLHFDYLLDVAWMKLSYTFFILMSVAFLVYWFVKSTGNFDNRTKKAMDFALLISLVPLISFTSANAFLFNTLAIAVLIVNFRNMPILMKVVTVIALVFVGGNSQEILGSRLANLFEQMSLVSIGSLVILALLYWLRFSRSDVIGKTIQ